MPHLIIERGKDKIRDYPLEGSIVTIGRASSDDIKLPGNRKISRYHAALIKTADEKGYFVRDLGSLSHTKLRRGNSSKIVYRKLLEDGDAIEIEDYTITYSREAKLDSMIEIIGDRAVDVQNYYNDETDTSTFVDCGIIEGISQSRKTLLIDVLNKIRSSATLSEVFENILDPQGRAQTYGVPNGRHLRLGCHHRQIEVLIQLPLKGSQARCVNAVVIGQKYFHRLCDSAPPANRGWPHLLRQPPLMDVPCILPPISSIFHCFK